MRLKTKPLKKKCKSKLIDDPNLVNLEYVKNPHQNLEYIVRLTSPEFTSICPITNQPDFGIIIIDYLPKKLIVESKSFKLFLHSFRNHGAFHEDCTIFIAKKIIQTIKPKWLRAAGYWNPRGGIFFRQASCLKMFGSKNMTLKVIKEGN